MRAGKDVCALVLVVALALLCGSCQTGPAPRDVARAQARPVPYPDRPADGAAPAAAPLRITQPPSAVAQGPRAVPTAGAAPVPTSAPPDGLPALPAPPATGTAPAATAPASPAEGDLRRLHRLAAEEYARWDGYIVRLTRREQVNGKDQPKEVIKVSFRRDPWSVHFVWLEGEAKGREVIYVKGRYDGKIMTRLGPTDGNLIMRPGSRIALAPDSLMVRNSSRHSITEAGIGSLIERFGALVTANEKGDRRWGTLTCRGPEKRPELAAPVEAAEQVIPAGAEKDLPRGGRRLWTFDAKSHLPALLVTTDDRGHEVEYYLHDRYVGPIHFDDKDFDPDRLWGKP